MSLEVAPHEAPTAESVLGCRLPTLPPGGHDRDALHALASGLRLAPNGWGVLAPYLQFDCRQYRRVRLWRDASWEGLLLCWLPGQCTTIHDHGGSIGIPVVLGGLLRERRHVASEAGGPLRCVEVLEVGPGSCSVEQAETIHDVANAGPGPAVSLHLYSPPLTILGAHDPATGRRWEVDVSDRPAVVVGGDPGVDA